VQGEPVEHTAECSLGRGDGLGVHDLAGNGCAQRGDALHELAGGVLDLHGRLDVLTLGSEVLERQRCGLGLALRDSGDTSPLVQRHALAQECIETFELAGSLGLDSTSGGQPSVDLGQTAVTLVGELGDGALHVERDVLGDDLDADSS
jgi:hypothetical protein